MKCEILSCLGGEGGGAQDKTTGNVNCRETAGICGGWLKSMVASLYYSTLPVSPENYPNYFVSESDVVIFPRLANSKTWHK